MTNTATTTDRDHLDRWIAAEDVVPGFIVQLPYGGFVALEVDGVEIQLGALNGQDVVVLHGWIWDEKLNDLRQVASRQPRQAPLWLTGDLRDLIAY